MSATLDSEKFSGYFQHCPVINIPGRTFPVQVKDFFIHNKKWIINFVLKVSNEYKNLIHLYILKCLILDLSFMVDKSELSHVKEVILKFFLSLVWQSSHPSKMATIY